VIFSPSGSCACSKAKNTSLYITGPSTWDYVKLCVALLCPSLGGKTSQAGAGAKPADGNASPQNTQLIDCPKASACLSTSESCIAPQGVWVELGAFLRQQGSLTWFHPMLESCTQTAASLQCLLGHLCLLIVVCSPRVSCGRRTSAALALLSTVCAAELAWARGWAGADSSSVASFSADNCGVSRQPGIPSLHRVCSFASHTTAS